MSAVSQRPGFGHQSRPGQWGGPRSRQVNVERTVKKVHPADWVVDVPKSKRSKRKVPVLDDELLAELTDYLISHPRAHEADAPLWPGRDHCGRLVYSSAEEPRYWNSRRSTAPCSVPLCRPLA